MILQNKRQCVITTIIYQKCMSLEIWNEVMFEISSKQEVLKNIKTFWQLELNDNWQWYYFMYLKK